MTPPLDAADVRAALVAKGMTADESHHTMFRKLGPRGQPVITRMSHNSKQIGDGLILLMARQCGLQRAEFVRLVECTLSAEKWDELIDERMPDGKNPFIPNR